MQIDVRCRRALVIVGLVLGFAIHAQAQEASGSGVAAPATTPLLTEAEVKAKYRTCPDGYYSGPQPGKARYTKDNFIWVVTPEFARRFCMPAEFVSAELKGAEAIAYRVVEDPYEEHCGWGGRQEVCGRMREHRFEIYFDQNANVPRAENIDVSMRPRYPSAKLITQDPKKYQERWLERRKNPALRSNDRVWPAFDLNQFGMDGVQDGRIAWPIVSFTEYEYSRSILPGISYVSLQGSMGFFANPRKEKLGITKFVITVANVGDKSLKDLGRPLTDFAHVIELPESFSEKLRAIDKTRAINIEELGKRALGIKPSHAGKGEKN